MGMNLDRHCRRCGKAEYTEEERERVEMDLLLHEDGAVDLFLPVNMLYEEDADAATGVCWDCLSLAEQWAVEGHCERCGKDPDEEPDRVGWTNAQVSLPVLCPDCQTADEQAQDTAYLLKMVEIGKQRAASEGRDYPADLALMAEVERLRSERRQQQLAEFRTALGDDA